MDVTKEDLREIFGKIDKQSEDINKINLKLSEDIKELTGVIRESLNEQVKIRGDINRIEDKIENFKELRFEVKSLKEKDEERKADINNIGSKIARMSADLKQELKDTFNTFTEMMKSITKNIELNYEKDRLQHEKVHAGIDTRIEKVEGIVEVHQDIVKYAKAFRWTISGLTALLIGGLVIAIKLKIF